MSDLTLQRKIQNFVGAWGPAYSRESHKKSDQFIKELREVMEEYGRMALFHGDLPDTEHAQHQKTPNEKLRLLLFASHGCSGKYGDDGEMQCSTCKIDFKRDAPEVIEQRLMESGAERARRLGTV